MGARECRLEMGTFITITVAVNVSNWLEESKLPLIDHVGYQEELDPCLRDLDLPNDWVDAELFQQLDQSAAWQEVFLTRWLPKCSLKMRPDPYRSFLRAINKRDPHFNIVWW